MDRLYLLRHGCAVPHGSPDFEDDDRPLLPEGERRARQVGHGLRRLGIKVDRIATSPLPRALRTAEIVAEALKAADLVEIVDDLRSGRDASSIRSWLEARAESRLMVVGHNPSLSDLLSLLVTGRDDAPICDLRKAGIAALRSEGGGPYRVDWIARPRLFRLG